MLGCRFKTAVTYCGEFSELESAILNDRVVGAGGKLRGVRRERQRESARGGAGCGAARRNQAQPVGTAHQSGVPIHRGTGIAQIQDIDGLCSRGSAAIDGLEQYTGGVHRQDGAAGCDKQRDRYLNVAGRGGDQDRVVISAHRQPIGVHLNLNKDRCVSRGGVGAGGDARRSRSCCLATMR